MSKDVLFMNSKQVYSRFSSELVTFVESLNDIAPDDNGVYSDGINLLDGVENVEDDIQQMYFILKDGSAVCCEDFYADHGAYDNDSNFIEDIKNLVADR